LRPNANAKVEYGSGGEEMVDDVVADDNIAMLCQSSINESFWIMLVDTLPIWSRSISYMFGGDNGLKETMSCKDFGMRDHIQVVGPITY